MTEDPRQSSEDSEPSADGADFDPFADTPVPDPGAFETAPQLIVVEPPPKGVVYVEMEVEETIVPRREPDEGPVRSRDVFIRLENRIYGPLTSENLESLLVSGRLTGYESASTDLTQWTPLAYHPKIVLRKSINVDQTRNALMEHTALPALKRRADLADTPDPPVEAIKSVPLAQVVIRPKKKQEEIEELPLPVVGDLEIDSMDQILERAGFFAEEEDTDPREPEFDRDEVTDPGFRSAKSEAARRLEGGDDAFDGGTTDPGPIERDELMAELSARAESDAADADAFDVDSMDPDELVNALLDEAERSVESELSSSDQHVAQFIELSDDDDEDDAESSLDDEIEATLDRAESALERAEARALSGDVPVVPAESKEEQSEQRATFDQEASDSFSVLEDEFEIELGMSDDEVQLSPDMAGRAEAGDKPIGELFSDVTDEHLDAIVAAATKRRKGRSAAPAQVTVASGDDAVAAPRDEEFGGPADDLSFEEPRDDIEADADDGSGLAEAVEPAPPSEAQEAPQGWLRALALGILFVLLTVAFFFFFQSRAESAPHAEAAQYPGQRVVAVGMLSSIGGDDAAPKHAPVTRRSSR